MNFKNHMNQNYYINKHKLETRGRKEQNCFQNIVPICVSPPCCGTFYVLPHCLPTDQQGLCIRIYTMFFIGLTNNTENTKRQ